MSAPTYTVSFGGVTRRGMSEEYAEHMKEEAGAEVTPEETIDDREHGDPVTLAPARPAYLEPTVGRIVHYQAYTQPEPLAAIVAAVHEDDRVNLTVLMPNGTTIPRLDVPYSAGPEDAHWNWPPRT